MHMEVFLPVMLKHTLATVTNNVYCQKRISKTQ